MRQDLEAALRLSNSLPSHTHYRQEPKNMSGGYGRYPNGRWHGEVVIGKRTFPSIIAAARELHRSTKTICQWIRDGRATRPGAVRK